MRETKGALNRIPAEPIVAVISAYLCSDGKRVGNGVYEKSDVVVLAMRIDILPDTLEKILSGRPQTIDFDVADRLLCAANMNDLWLTDLREIYYGALLADGVKQHKVESASGARVCARSGCSNRFVPPARCRRKKYCCDNCKSTDWKHKHNGVKSSARGKNRVFESLVCRNGHERTKENTGFTIRGTRYCLICHREAGVRFREKRRLGLAS